MWSQAEANVLVTSGPVLANGSFIAIPESSDCANDAGSAANSPHDTPSVTPTKHIQHKVASLGQPAHSHDRSRGLGSHSFRQCKCSSGPACSTAAAALPIHTDRGACCFPTCFSKCDYSAAWLMLTLPHTETGRGPASCRYQTHVARLSALDLHMQVAGGAKPTRLTYSWGKPSRKTAKDPTPAKSPTQRPLCFEGASSDAGEPPWPRKPYSRKPSSTQP